MIFMSSEKTICDFLLVINSNLGHISHILATIHPLHTDGQTDDNSYHIAEWSTFKLTAERLAQL